MIDISKYERKAEEVLENAQHQKPEERNMGAVADAIIVLAGSKIMDAMGGEMGRYDGMGRDEFRRGRSERTGRYTSRYDGMGGGQSGGQGGRSGGRYDGMDEDEEMEYRRGGGRGRGRYDGGGY